DIGVHQDGLVHISALSEQFVKDPRDVVRVGQAVKVKVQEVDVARNRIGLTMRLNDNTGPAQRRDSRPGSPARQPGSQRGQSRGQARDDSPMNAMAAAFAKLKK